MDRPTRPTRINFHAPDGTGLEVWEEMNPDNLLSGTPVQRGYLCDELGGYIAGVWDCTAFEDHPSAYGVDEFMYLLEGSVVMVMPDGEEITINAGESFIIPKGLDCQWKQPGYVRKIFMILDREEVSPASNPSLSRITKPDHGGPALADGAVVASATEFVNAAGNMKVSVSAHAATTSASSPAPAHQVIYVLEGALTLSHEGADQSFAKDEAVYLPQGSVVGWQTESGTRLLVSSYVS